MINARLVRNIRLGVKTLLLHKLRSVLTMLGVVFGVASVIAMLAVGEGSKRDAVALFERMGTNNIILTSRKPADAAAPGGEQAGSRVLSYGLKYETVDWVERTVPGVRRAVPARRLSKTAQVKNRRIDMELIGTTPDWFDLINRRIIAGRTLNATDMRRYNPVIVLTESTARRLLATERTIGQRVIVDERVFTVVGIIESETRIEEGGDQTLDTGKDAFIPLSTMRELYGELISESRAGESSREIVDLHQIIVEMEQTEHVVPAAGVIRTMLQREHDMADYTVEVPLQLLRDQERTQMVWNITLSAIAGISLLVGGIGIMNIMLASVTERTREIGIRRAIGAKRNQIVMQFLTESLLLATCGGLVGLVLGVWVLPWAIESYSGGEINAIVTATPIVLSLAISIGVGVIFGLYPAIRASRLDPIVALRHE